MKKGIKEMEIALRNVIEKYNLPVNIIVYLAELHNNGGCLIYGTSRFPVSISNSVNKKHEAALSKVPYDFYCL